MDQSSEDRNLYKRIRNQMELIRLLKDPRKREQLHRDIFTENDPERVQHHINHWFVETLGPERAMALAEKATGGTLHLNLHQHLSLMHDRYGVQSDAQGDMCILTCYMIMSTLMECHFFLAGQEIPEMDEESARGSLIEITELVQLSAMHFALQYWLRRSVEPDDISEAAEAGRRALADNPEDLDTAAGSSRESRNRRLAATYAFACLAADITWAMYEKPGS